jgi:hypothetical protein
MIRRVVPFFIVFLVGCASVHIKTTAIVSLQTAVAIGQLQELVKASHDAEDISDAGYIAWKKSFLKLSIIGKALDKALLGGNEKDIFTQVNAGLGILDTMLKENILSLSPEKRTPILMAISSARLILIVAGAYNGT